ncbi:hypothetical protein SASPL_147964 [Salvia splendens]|uniref:Transcriptional regulator n=1 Tax=Salvia splendens TaxID=180675 RepID=A0A8X8W8F8_SALSN|nr:UPF0301 protein CAB604-like [Salvia splendens]KAG6390232.1 hypothetical protein SASPL_147964 [Salvia splendens]
MDLWCVHVKSSGFMPRNSFSEKPFCWSSNNYSMNSDLRLSKPEFAPSNCRLRSVSTRAMAKMSSGNCSNSNSNSSSSDSGGNNDNLKAGGDGNNPSPGIKKSDNTNSKNPQCEPLDWREFRAQRYFLEQAEKDETSPGLKPLPSKWAHPISAPENGCLLIATEKLDGVHSFERTVVLLLRSGTRNPQEGPFGVVINRPLHEKMKHMNPSGIVLGNTFDDCSLHFGGPLHASMFLLRSEETTGLADFAKVIPGVYFGSRNSLGKASAMIKKGKLLSQDFTFFMGYAGWQLDQLREEIESDYWHVAACSSNLISLESQRPPPDNLWEKILQLMGGPYSELSRKPKQDI